MHDRLVDLLEKVDRSIADSRGVVPEEDLELVAGVAARVRARLGYPGDLIIVGLAGGTGSGKSSVVNALAGEEISEVGGVRPTTSSPIAVAGPDRIPSIIGYLRELGINVRTMPGFPRWLVLVDLPDTDSVEVEHRLKVEALLPGIDAVVWVTDPEKYRDEVLHEHFLRPLIAHEQQMAFVVNQVDRLGAGDIEQVLADFAGALAEDGFRAAEPIAMAANPPAGPPIGVAELVEALEGLASAPWVLQTKLLTDLQLAVGDLSAYLVGGPDAFDEEVEAILDSAAEAVADGRSSDADAMLTRFVVEMAADIGGLTGDELRDLTVGIPRVVGSSEEALRRAVVDHRSALPRFRWSDKGDVLPEDDRITAARNSLESGLLPDVRALLARRSAAASAMRELELALESAISR